MEVLVRKVTRNPSPLNVYKPNTAAAKGVAELLEHKFPNVSQSVSSLQEVHRNTINLAVNKSIFPVPVNVGQFLDGIFDRIAAIEGKSVGETNRPAELGIKHLGTAIANTRLGIASRLFRGQ